jgi:hypothetical protein
MRRRTSPALVAFGLLAAGWVCWGLVSGNQEPPTSMADERTLKEKQPVVKEDGGRIVVRQGFPAGKADATDLSKSDTAWEIEWTITSPDNGYFDPKAPRKDKEKGKIVIRHKAPSSVLAIRSARFMYKDRHGKTRWVNVLKNLEMGEMFVPYDTTNPTFLDVARHAFFLIPAKKEFLGPACVLPGEILTSADPRMSNKVMKEVHDDGVRWLNGQNKARRGEKMMLWSAFNGGNYRYLIEYNFRDDGAIECRVGATAHNIFNRQADGRDVHLHVGCWRWDMDVSDVDKADSGGADKNAVQMVRRKPKKDKPAGHFIVEVKAFNAGDNGEAREGHEDWVAEEFTTLRIESTARKNNNPQPRLTSYDVMPIRYGSVRNYPKHHHFVNHDFWVTRADAAHKLYERVPEYSKQQRTLEGHPVTIWHSSPAVHTPRAEDYGVDGVSSGRGSAVTTWTGFMLRPRNLFDSTPLYPTGK